MWNLHLLYHICSEFWYENTNSFIQLGAVLAAVDAFASRDISIRVLYFLVLDSLFVVTLCEVKIYNERQLFCKPTSVQL